MPEPLHPIADLGEAALIDPYHVEFPCWCVRCGDRWSIYRKPNAPYATMHDDVATLHREVSPICGVRHIRIAKPVPYGASAPEVLEEHDDSPFAKGR